MQIFLGGWECLFFLTLFPYNAWWDFSKFPNVTANLIMELTTHLALILHQLKLHLFFFKLKFYLDVNYIHNTWALSGIYVFGSHKDCQALIRRLFDYMWRATGLDYCNQNDNVVFEYAISPIFKSHHQGISSGGLLPFQWAGMLQARVTLKISEVGLFNYCVLMIKWEQHNGLINFLITVCTKSNYNHIHRLVNHTSIKLKQSSLGSNHFQTEQMSRLSRTSASSEESVYPGTTTPSKGYTGWLEPTGHGRTLNRKAVCAHIMSEWKTLSRTKVNLFALSDH